MLIWSDTMFTDKKLTEAYQNAKIECFDEKSKYIFFSDCHRGDDSISDEFSRNQPVFLHALNYYYQQGHTYIELGDGDELWEYPEFKHIRSAHSDVFSVLKKFHKKNRLLMLYGNHNNYLRYKPFVKKNYYYFPDNYTNKKMHVLFKGIEPYEALLFKCKNTGQEIFAVHGHQGDFMNDQFWYASMFLLRYLWRYLHVVGFHNPSSPARNLYRRHKVEKTYKKWIRKHKTMLICGHTHRPRFPQANELPYFNTGCCIRTKGITGIELEDNKVSMVDWRIRADLEGNLKIVRFVVRGPEPIENFDFRKHQFLW